MSTGPQISCCTREAFVVVSVSRQAADKHFIGDVFFVVGGRKEKKFTLNFLTGGR